jgi:FixJ family two-component response regulator
VIFIIDDDKYVLRGFQILLQSAGMNSMIFGSVEEFLKIWEPSKTDIVILDIHMPGLSGCDFLKYLQKEDLFMPVIIVTAYDEAETRHAAINYGALAYLTKPVDGEELLDLLRNEKPKLEHLID